MQRDVLRLGNVIATCGHDGPQSCQDCRLVCRQVEVKPPGPITRLAVGRYAEVAETSNAEAGIWELLLNVINDRGHLGQHVGQVIVVAA